MEYSEPNLEEDSRFVEVTEEFDRLSRKSDFARGRVLCQIRDEKLFGRFGNFEDCVSSRLKVKPRYAYYLMDAAETFDLLEQHQCPQLPNNERQIRPLNSLKDDKLKVLAWERACQQKRQDSPPDSHDVAREVRRLLGSIPDKESDDAYRAYRKSLDSAASEYRRAHEMLEEGDLDGFLAAEDPRSKQQRKRLLAMLGKFTATLHGDALALQGVPKEETEEKESAGMVRSNGRTSHFLLPCCRPRTRFQDVLDSDLLAMAA